MEVSDPPLVFNALFAFSTLVGAIALVWSYLDKDTHGRLVWERRINDSDLWVAATLAAAGGYIGYPVLDAAPHFAVERLATGFVVGSTTVMVWFMLRWKYSR